MEETCKSENYRKTARNLFIEVNKLVDKAGRTADGAERHELYLQAMSMSNKAYSLLGKAREIRRNKARPAKKL